MQREVIDSSSRIWQSYHQQTAQQTIITSLTFQHFIGCETTSTTVTTVFNKIEKFCFESTKNKETDFSRKQLTSYFYLHDIFGRNVRQVLARQFSTFLGLLLKVGTENRGKELRNEAITTEMSVRVFLFHCIYRLFCIYYLVELLSNPYLLQFSYSPIPPFSKY